MSEKPKRIQRSRAKGWKMPAGTIYVGRPTLWGNPFVCDDASRAVDAYRKHCEGGTQSFQMGGPGGVQFARNAHPNTLHWAWPDWMRTHIFTELRGHDLACWCRLDQPCHADALLELANAEATHV